MAPATAEEIHCLSTGLKGPGPWERTVGAMATSQGRGTEDFYPHPLHVASFTLQPSNHLTKGKICYYFLSYFMASRIWRKWNQLPLLHGWLCSQGFLKSKTWAKWFFASPPSSMTESRNLQQLLNFEIKCTCSARMESTHCSYGTQYLWIKNHFSLKTQSLSAEI